MNRGREGYRIIPDAANPNNLRIRSATDPHVCKVYGYTPEEARIKAERIVDALALPVGGGVEEALRNLIELCRHGDFKNGVTDSSGSVDEGEVRAADIISEAEAALSPTTLGGE